MTRRPFPFAASLLALLAFAPASQGADHQVVAGGFTFQPSRIVIQVGDTVTWTNSGGIHSVEAEDGSFSSGDAAPDDSSVWPFTHRFDRPGVFPYVCVPHEFHGMRGLVEVEGPGHPGIPEMVQTVFTVSEGDGGAVIGVRRAKGSTGAISVAYAAKVFSTTPGNATAGLDFQEVSGILAWADGESTDRSFTVPILDDSTLEGEEILTVELSAPAGGATLHPMSRSASLKIVDEDGAVPLTAGEVRCDAARLSGLLERAAAAVPGAGAPGLNLHLTVTGDFAGLAYAGVPAGPERHLAFSTNPEETPLLRNPSRPQLSALSLTRNALSSDLVKKGEAGEIRLTVNPTLGAGTEGALRIDNVEGAPGASVDTKPGRGLAELAAPCHDRLSVQDVHVLRVLAKVARASAQNAAAVELALFRGESPATYRIDVYPVSATGAALGRLAAEVMVTWSATGDLLSGTMRVLGRCSAAQTEHCTNVSLRTDLLLVPPAAGGTPAALPAASVWTFGAEGDGQPRDDVNWSSLLAGTSWRRPL